MRTRRRILSIAAAMLCATALSGVGVAVAAPPSNGCTPGYQLLVVADLTAQGYRVPAMMDDPTSGLLSFGQPGNGDGLVCARQLGNQLTTFGAPIYNFMDNGLPAS